MKKIVAILLCLLAVPALLAGCGDDTGNTAETQATSETSAIAKEKIVQDGILGQFYSADASIMGATAYITILEDGTFAMENYYEDTYSIVNGMYEKISDTEVKFLPLKQEYFDGTTTTETDMLEADTTTAAIDGDTLTVGEDESMVIYYRTED